MTSPFLKAMEAPAFYLIKLAPLCSESQMQSSLNWHLMRKCKHCQGMELMGHDLVLTLHNRITSPTEKYWVWIFCLLLDPSSFSQKRTRQLLRGGATCLLYRCSCPCSSVFQVEIVGILGLMDIFVLFCR